MVYLSWGAGAARRRRSSCSPWKPTVKRCLRSALQAPVLSLFLANCPAMINALHGQGLRLPYPGATVSGSSLFVAYSVNKEDIEVLEVPLKLLV